MPDIFLSYSRDDQATARWFAEGLERQGFSVWWDVTLRSGEAYDQVTEKALREAKAVVVLWSKKSVDSRWVRAEATMADRSGTLVPVMIEPCVRPIMFELTHTADLTQWKGDPNDKAWKAYVADVRRFVEKGGAADTAVPQAASVGGPKHAPRFNAPATIGIAAAAVIIVGIVAWALTRPRGEAAPTSPAAAATTAPDATATAAPTAALRTSVAVMPFANLTGDPTKDYLGDGMAEELINVLVKVPGLTVPSRTSSFAYKGRNTDLKQIGKDLNVGTILEGSVRSAGTTIRITAQLIDAQTDRHLWSSTYDRDFADLFKLQDDLAHEIVTAFQKTTGANVQNFASQAPPTKDLEAYSLYLQARSLVSRNSQTSEFAAIERYDRAIARDPAFAAAYLGKAYAQGLAGVRLAEVESNARRAIALAPELARAAGVVLAGVESKRGNWSEAEKMIGPLAPGSQDALVHVDYVLSVLWPTGQMRKALREYAEAYRLAPASGSAALQLGMVHNALGETSEALELANASVALGVDATGRRSQQLFAQIAEQSGRYDEAAEHMVSALSDGIRIQGGADVIKLVYAAMKDPARKSAAVAALRDLVRRLAPEDWVVNVWAMNWFSRFGEMDDAYEAGERVRKAFAARGQSPTNAWAWLWTTELRSFRRDPRFQSFVTRLGLMKYWQEYGPPDDCTLNKGKLTCR